MVVTCGQVAHSELTGDFDFQVFAGFGLLLLLLLIAGELGAEGGGAGVVLDGTAVEVLGLLGWLAWSVGGTGYLCVFAIVAEERCMAKFWGGLWCSHATAKLRSSLWCAHTTAGLLVLVLREGCPETVALIFSFDEACVQ